MFRRGKRQELQWCEIPFCIVNCCRCQLLESESGERLQTVNLLKHFKFLMHLQDSWSVSAEADTWKQPVWGIPSSWGINRIQLLWSFSSAAGLFQLLNFFQSLSLPLASLSLSFCWLLLDLIARWVDHYFDPTSNQFFQPAAKISRCLFLLQTWLLLH